MSTVRTATFADVLRRHRKAAGLIQQELATAAGLSRRRAVSDLERGLCCSPHADTVHLLADALTLTDASRSALTSASKRNRSTTPSS